MNEHTTAKKPAYAGLFFITLATLMYEVLLTRIFSVTMWYHFAFMAISIAMFGMTVGAIAVYLFPGFFIARRAKYHMCLSGFLFAVTVVLSFLVHLRIPFVFQKSLTGLFSIASTYVVISVPFFFSGICVCIALTKFPRQVSRLYAVDLAGAALGCFALIITLSITDGLTAVMVVGALASVGAAFFAMEEGMQKLLASSVALALLLAGFCAVNTVMVNRQSPLLMLKWVKGAKHWQPLFEKWNSFSYFKIIGDPSQYTDEPAGWGLSRKCPTSFSVKQLLLMIDAFAGTPLTDFGGDFANLDFLKYDIINLVHYLRSNASVCVVGVGGGRDVLSALAFGQKSIVGIEINKDIIDAVNKRFGDFTGHIDTMPGVTIVNDEARSYITKTKQKFDILQISFIDTWAATAAGAFVLTENSLYTVEAWKIFFDHLTDNGIVTFSRWYFQGNPGEVYRLTSLAAASLQEMGIKDPRRHLILVRNMFIRSRSLFRPDGVGTILVSRSPFSDADIDRVEEVARTLEYEVVLSPRFALDSTFATIASGRNLRQFTESFPIDISPTTDDKPFFFNMLRFRDILKTELWNQGSMTFNMRAIFILGSLLLTVIVLTLLCIITPLALTVRKISIRKAFPLLLYFACIGFAFMLVEIALMQRLIVFLGHPVYSLSVVLFALLLSGGIGSFSTQQTSPADLRLSTCIRFGLLLVTVYGFNLVLPDILTRFQASSNTVRIIVATGLIFPLGFFMGMAFPIGMKVAAGNAGDITPWLWGINGAASVCASVVAVVISIGAGISTTYLVGFIFYVAASASLFWSTRHGAQA